MLTALRGDLFFLDCYLALPLHEISIELRGIASLKASEVLGESRADGNGEQNIEPPDSLPEGRKTLSVIEGDAAPQCFIPKLISLYQAGQFPFDRLVRFYDFSGINQTIADAMRGDAIKSVLRN
jgi:Zn-dependent alcohol dehydrogenase